MECNICQQQFDSELELINHKEGVHKIFKCPNCSYTTKRKADLHRHQSTKHVFSVKCSHCNRKFKSNDLLNEHMNNEHQLHSCNICHFKTYLSDSLSKHMKIKHGSDRKRSSPDLSPQASKKSKFHETIDEEPVAGPSRPPDNPLIPPAPPLPPPQQRNEVKGRFSNLIHHYKFKPRGI